VICSRIQNHNQQLKGEVSRYKRKLKEAQAEIVKIKSGDTGAGEAVTGKVNSIIRRTLNA
jgi:hypothetical protein